MNNTVTLENCVPYADKMSSYVDVNSTLCDLSLCTVTNSDGKEVCDYVSLDFEGINLLDESLMMAEQGVDNIGVVSNAVMYNNFMCLRINLSTPTVFPISYGYCWHHQTTGPIFKATTYFHGTNYDRINAEIYMYDSNGNRVAYDRHGTAFVDPGRPVYVKNNKYVIEWTFPYTGTAISYIDIFVTVVYKKSRQYGIAKLDGIKLGEVTELSLIDNIECHGEIDLTFSDVPSSTTSITVETTSEPTQGQHIQIESDQHNGRYIIDNVTQIAKNIYQIECVDDVMVLEETLYDGSSATTLTALKATSLCTFIDVSDDDLAQTYSGSLDEKTNCRQWLAMCSLCLGTPFSTFNQLIGIKQYDIDTSSTTEYISSDRILNRAEYKAREIYNGVIFPLTVNDVDYIGTATSDVQAYKTAGWYSLDGRKLYNSGATIAGGLSDTAEIAKEYLNGAEVTATIIYNGEQLGDYVSIQTPFNGTISGIIYSIDLTMSNTADIATIIIREVS